MYSCGHAFFQQQHPFHLVEQILTVAKINTSQLCLCYQIKRVRTLRTAGAAQVVCKQGKLPRSLPQNRMNSFTLDQLYQYPACTALGLPEMR